MSELSKTRKLAEQAQREERIASDEMSNNEYKATDLQAQLETILQYREECHNGLKTAKESRLSVVQIRECQLLIQYLDTVVETRQYKADISQEKYEDSKITWKKKREHLDNIKEKLELLEAAEEVMSQDAEINDASDMSGKDYQTYPGKLSSRQQ